MQPFSAPLLYLSLLFDFSLLLSHVGDEWVPSVL
jgi:hypothetical protein